MGGGSGHWTYFDDTGYELNSYLLGHQKPGTNQFCQSFALIYMINKFGNTKWFSELLSVNNIPASDRTDDKEAEIWGHNIRVVLSFWSYFINELGDDMTDWCINQFKEINDEYVDHNKSNKRESQHLTLIHPKTDEITVDTIFAKFEDIAKYSEIIAQQT
jgi:hypothetical protein